MRKILVLAILFAFVSSFNASAQQSITLPCGDSLIVKTQPGRETVELKKNKKPYNPPARGAVNNFTFVNINSGNNNNSPVYPQSAQNNCRQCGVYGCAGGHYWYGDNSGLLTLLIIGFAIYALWRLFRTPPAPGTSSVTYTHTHTHKHEFTPPASRVGDEKSKAPVAPAIDVTKMQQDLNLQGTGAIVNVRADGSVSIVYPKPEAKKEN